MVAQGIHVLGARERKLLNSAWDSLEEVKFSPRTSWEEEF